MIDLIGTSLRLCSPLQVPSHGFDSLLEAHGLSAHGWSPSDCRRASGFLYHMLNGMCAYGLCEVYQKTMGFSYLDISCRVFAVICCGSFDVLNVACQSLGFFLDFEHQCALLSVFSMNIDLV